MQLAPENNSREVIRKELSQQGFALRVMQGNYYGIELPRERLIEVATQLRDLPGQSFDLLSSVSGLDLGDHLEVVYHLRSTAAPGNVLQMRVRCDENNAVDSLTGVWKTANWLERETYDMFGIHFRGHPNLTRILLDDDFGAYPLLKSFQPVPFTRKDHATTQASPLGEKFVEWQAVPTAQTLEAERSGAKLNQQLNGPQMQGGQFGVPMESPMRDTSGSLKERETLTTNQKGGSLGLPIHPIEEGAPEKNLPVQEDLRADKQGPSPKQGEKSSEGH